MNVENPISNWMTNLVSGGAVAATLLGYVPSLAAIVALLWYFIQISESETVRRWVAARRTRKLARLKARVIMLEAQSHAALPMPKKFGDGNLDTFV